jgi:hypothetical protein
MALLALSNKAAMDQTSSTQCRAKYANLPAPEPISRISSRERFNQEEEPWTFTKKSPKENLSPIERYTTITFNTTAPNGTTTPRHITTSNTYILCPCCHTGPRPANSKNEHHIFPHLLKDEFSPPPASKKFSQLTTWEKYLRDKFQEKRYDEAKQISQILNYECMEHWRYGVYSPENEDAIADDDGEWGVHTIHLGHTTLHRPKAMWEFGRVPRNLEELERCKERYIELDFVRMRELERRYGYMAVEESRLRKVAENDWKIQLGANVKAARSGADDGEVVMWEGFDGVWMAGKEEEAEGSRCEVQ